MTPLPRQRLPHPWFQPSLRHWPTMALSSLVHPCLFCRPSTARPLRSSTYIRCRGRTFETEGPFPLRGAASLAVPLDPPLVHRPLRIVNSGYHARDVRKNVKISIKKCVDAMENQFPGLAALTFRLIQITLLTRFLISFTGDLSSI